MKSNPNTDKEIETKERIMNLIKERNRLTEQLNRMIIKTQNESIRKINLLNGVILGLSVGIAGTFLAQFSYSMIEGFFIPRYDYLFIGSFFGFLISLIAVILIISHYRKMRDIEKQFVDNNLDSAEMALRNRIDNIEVELENLRLGFK